MLYFKRSRNERKNTMNAPQRLRLEFFKVNIMRIVMNTLEKLTWMVKRGVVPLGFLTKQPTKGHPSC